MKIKNLLIACGLGVALFTACSGDNGLTKSELDPAKFDSIVDNKEVHLYTLTNADGMEVCVTNYGARIVSVMAKDKNGAFRDVVLGFDNLNQYITVEGNNFGAAIGRYGNRINKGKITVAGKQYQLTQNNYGHCLHGGNNGYHANVFDVKEVTENKLVLTFRDEFGKEQFPGNLDVTITYTLTDDNALDILYEATTDEETICNLTNHSYFNLSGHPEAENWNHEMFINADNYTPVDSTFMTTGEIRPVYGNQFDFTKAKALSTCIADTTGYNGLQIKWGMGIDHNFCLNTYKDGKGDDTKVAATLYSPESGIQMSVYTNEPGVQVYTGNFLDGTVAGKKGIKYPKQASVCLETQKYPDSPNKKDWPQPYLKPGEQYTSHTVYKFSTK
ncbi:MAG: aldose epimerase family protein [Prevotellaceae bacterium]|nr:aldose epimerase family protein [Prevotellaceae bacterium]